MWFESKKLRKHCKTFDGGGVTSHGSFANTALHPTRSFDNVVVGVHMGMHPLYETVKCTLIAISHAMIPSTLLCRCNTCRGSVPTRRWNFLFKCCPIQSMPHGRRQRGNGTHRTPGSGQDRRCGCRPDSRLTLRQCSCYLFARSIVSVALRPGTGWCGRAQSVALQLTLVHASPVPAISIDGRHSVSP